MENNYKVTQHGYKETQINHRDVKTQTNKCKNSLCVSFGVGVLLLCTDGGVGVLLDACTQTSQSIQDYNKGPETDRDEDVETAKTVQKECVRTNWFTSF